MWPLNAPGVTWPHPMSGLRCRTTETTLASNPENMVHVASANPANLPAERVNELATLEPPAELRDPGGEFVFGQHI